MNTLNAEPISWGWKLAHRVLWCALPATFLAYILEVHIDAARGFERWPVLFLSILALSHLIKFEASIEQRWAARGWHPLRFILSKAALNSAIFAPALAGLFEYVSPLNGWEHLPTLFAVGFGVPFFFDGLILLLIRRLRRA